MRASVNRSAKRPLAVSSDQNWPRFWVVPVMAGAVPYASTASTHVSSVSTLHSRRRSSASTTPLRRRFGRTVRHELIHHIHSWDGVQIPRRGSSAPKPPRLLGCTPAPLERWLPCLGHKLDRLFPLPLRNFLFRHCPVLPFSRTLDVRLSGDPLCQPVLQRLLSAPERQTLRVELAMIVAHKVLRVCRRNAGSAEPNRRARALSLTGAAVLVHDPHLRPRAVRVPDPSTRR